MLVVAEQDAVGIGRQRGLAGARQAEEHRHVAVRGPTLAEQCIGMTLCGGSTKFR